MLVLKKFITILILGLGSILLQGTVFKSVLPIGCVPNLLCAILVYLALYEISLSGVFLASLLGLLLDIYSTQLLGPWLGAYIFVYLFITLFAQRIYVGSVLTFCLAVGLASALSALVYLFMIVPYQEVGTAVVKIAFFESLLSALFAPLMYKLLHFVYPKSVEIHGKYGQVF